MINRPWLARPVLRVVRNETQCKVTHQKLRTRPIEAFR
jgi:hypothetical protein